MRLSFLNANWLRQYPFRSDSGITDLQNQRLPTDLLAGLRITVDMFTPTVTSEQNGAVLRSNEPYVRRIVTGNSNISVEIYSNDTLLGTAKASIVSSNQTVDVIAPNGGSIGTVTIGNPTSCETVAAYTFDNIVCQNSEACHSGFVEPSTVSIIRKPAVAFWQINQSQLTGYVNFASESLNKSTTSLSVANPSTVISQIGRAHV